MHLHQVLVALPGQEPHFEPVFMFSHQDEQSINTFRKLVAENGQTLTLTPGHYLWASKAIATNDFQLVRAADVKVGEWVWALNGTNHASVVATRITSVSTRSARGLYNPHTASGSIIVDSMAAATFTDSISASLAMHGLVTLPAQLLYQLTPTRALAARLNTVLLTVYFRSAEAFRVLLASTDFSAFSMAA